MKHSQLTKWMIWQYSIDKIDSWIFAIEQKQFFAKSFDLTSSDWNVLQKYVTVLWQKVPQSYFT